MPAKRLPPWWLEHLPSAWWEVDAALLEGLDTQRPTRVLISPTAPKAIPVSYDRPPQTITVEYGEAPRAITLTGPEPDPVLRQFKDRIALAPSKLYLEHIRVLFHRIIRDAATHRLLRQRLGEGGPHALTFNQRAARGVPPPAERDLLRPTFSLLRFDDELRIQFRSGHAPIDGGLSEQRRRDLYGAVYFSLATAAATAEIYLRAIEEPATPMQLTGQLIDELLQLTHWLYGKTLARSICALVQAAIGTKPAASTVLRRAARQGLK